MSDISRSGMSDIVLADADLRLKHTRILISEKLNQMKQLEVNLDRIKTVDMQRLELAKETLAKEIRQLQAEIKGSVVEAEVTLEEAYHG